MHKNEVVFGQIYFGYCSVNLDRIYMKPSRFEQESNTFIADTLFLSDYKVVDNFSIYRHEIIRPVDNALENAYFNLNELLK